MLVLLIKSRPLEPTEKLPLKEKLRLILMEKIKEAKTDEERMAAKKELAKLGIEVD